MTRPTVPPLRRRWRLIVLTTLLALVQAGAAIHALQVPPPLAVQVSLVLPLETAAGGLWALLFAAITVNLLRRRAARPAALALGGFLIYSTLRLIVFTRADYDAKRLPFLVAVTLCLLIFLAIFWLRR